MKTATLDRLHGIALIALMSLSAFYIAGIPEVKALSLSPLIVGIIIGMIYANTLRCGMPKEWEPGIKFCTKRLLRLGIIFYGFPLDAQRRSGCGTASSNRRYNHRCRHTAARTPLQPMD